MVRWAMPNRTASSMDPERGHAALRRGRVSAAGQVYLVTTTTFRREPLFADFARASRLAAVVADTRIWRGGRMLCWVLMPDHLHLLLELGAHDTLDTAIGRFKAVSAARVRPAGSASPVWSRGFHDRALRRDENLVGAARYLIANPLRAGLVTRVGDYPFWDAVWLDPSKGNIEPV